MVARERALQRNERTIAESVRSDTLPLEARCPEHRWRGLSCERQGPDCDVSESVYIPASVRRHGRRLSIQAHASDWAVKKLSWRFLPVNS